MEVLLMPGMDGTGALFSKFKQHLPYATRIISYPPDEVLSYSQLLERIDVPSVPFAIVAESFSGPLAIRLAQHYGSQVKALVLVASFVTNPSKLAFATQMLMSFAPQPPPFALRWALLDTDGSKDTSDTTSFNASDLISALRTVQPSVLLHRLKEVIAIDVTQPFQSLVIPVLYIAGKQDRIVRLSVAKALKQLRSDLEVHIINAPHLVLQSNPLEAARVISDFLQRVTAKGIADP